MTGVELRDCIKCGEAKPSSEFYPDKSKADGLKSMCKTCDNARVRGDSVPRIIYQRARNRATAALIDRYRDEFQQLVDQFTVECADEHERLVAAQAEKQEPVHTHVHEPDPEPVVHRPATPPKIKVATSPPPRLRPGPRAAGEDVTDRLDVARCKDCRTYHDKGHVCARCGLRATPPVKGPAGVDLAALEDFTAGTERIRR